MPLQFTSFFAQLPVYSKKSEFASMEDVLKTRLDWMNNETKNAKPPTIEEIEAQNSEAQKYFEKDPENGEKEAHEGRLVARIHLQDGDVFNIFSER